MIASCLDLRDEVVIVFSDCCLRELESGGPGI